MSPDFREMRLHAGLNNESEVGNETTFVGSRPSVPFELRSADMPERLQVTAGWNETILTESCIVMLDLAKF